MSCEITEGRASMKQEQDVIKRNIQVKMLVIYCCITNYPKTYQLTSHISYITASVGQNPGSNLARWFWLKVSHAISIKCSAGMQFSEDSTRPGGSSLRWLTTQLLTGDLSFSLHETLHNNIVCSYNRFPPEQIIQKRRNKTPQCPL